MLLRHTGSVNPVFLYVPGERLSQAELCAARLDGDVVELGDVYTPADLVESTVTRAHGIEIHRQGHTDLAFVGPSAAWIHGAGDQSPNHHHLQRTTAKRARVNSSLRTTMHGSMLPSGDVMTIGSILVATPERALLDLARWSDRDPAHTKWAVALHGVFPHALEGLQARVGELRGQPGYRAARRTLALLATSEQSELCTTTM